MVTSLLPHLQLLACRGRDAERPKSRYDAEHRNEEITAMDWRKTLTDIFAAYINQDTLEEAVHAMLFVSEDDPVCHREFTVAIENGLEAVGRGDADVLGIINQSGYGVMTAEQGRTLLLELQRLYLDGYNKRQQER
jgi:hypothetical protein